ncbi:MAG: hypothetical protein AAGE52_07200 [Myxococcota bacterium]
MQATSFALGCADLERTLRDLLQPESAPNAERWAGRLYWYRSGVQWFVPHTYESGSERRLFAELGRLLSELSLVRVALDVDALDRLPQSEADADDPLPSHVWTAERITIRGGVHTHDAFDDADEFYLHGDVGETLDYELYQRFHEPEQVAAQDMISGYLHVKAELAALSSRLRDLAEAIQAAGAYSQKIVRGQTMLRVASPEGTRLAAVTDEELAQLIAATGLSPR